MPISAQTTQWQGSDSHDWRSAEDWSKGVPGKTTKTIVSVGGPSRFDVIVPPPSGADTACSGDLTIQNGGRLFLQDGPNPGILVVHGDALLLNGGEVSLRDGIAIFKRGLKLNNGGLLSSDHGTIMLQGDLTSNPGSFLSMGSGHVIVRHGTKSLTGSVTFSDLTIEADDSVSVNGDIVVEGTLTIENGSTLIVTQGSSLRVDGVMYCFGQLIDQNILPVQLQSFDATFAGDAVSLTWSTSTETDNEGFFVERRPQDGTPAASGWVRVGFVEGSGTSTSARSYSFSDRAVTPGSYVYRLFQVDRSGGSSTSDERSVTVDMRSADPEVRSYPNPFNPRTTIEIRLNVEADVRLAVYDITGREVELLLQSALPQGQHSVVWNADHVASGVYYYALNMQEKHPAGRHKVLVGRLVLLR